MRLLRVSLAVLISIWGYLVRAEEPQKSGAASTTHLRVMSFNIRNSKAQDGENQWSKRRELFFQTVRTSDPDLVGFQEVLLDQYDELLAAFPTYAAVGVARTDGDRKGEWSLILYRKSRFEEKGQGTFWLSEEPEKVGSRGWDAALERICSWAKLHDRTTGKDLLYANTHFDHKGEQARVQSAALLRKQLGKLAGDKAVVLTGDFNSVEDGEAYRNLVGQTNGGAAQQHGGGGITLIDSYREVHAQRSPEEATFHAFKGRTTGSRIDWILHTAEFKTCAAEIVRTRDGERFPSDHFAVTAVLEGR